MFSINNLSYRLSHFIGFCHFEIQDFICEKTGTTKALHNFNQSRSSSSTSVALGPAVLQQHILPPIFDRCPLDWYPEISSTTPLRLPFFGVMDIYAIYGGSSPDNSESLPDSLRMCLTTLISSQSCRNTTAYPSIPGVPGESQDSSGGQYVFTLSVRGVDSESGTSNTNFLNSTCSNPGPGSESSRAPSRSLNSTAEINNNSNIPRFLRNHFVLYFKSRENEFQPLFASEHWFERVEKSD